jgi:hypothetical protein
VAQHEEFDVFGGGRSGHQQDQSEHLPEDQVQQPQRHAGIMSDRRSSLFSDPGPSSGTPQARRLATLHRDEEAYTPLAPASARCTELGLTRLPTDAGPEIQQLLN